MSQGCITNLCFCKHTACYPLAYLALIRLTYDTDAGHVYKAIDALPVTAHPMTQFTTGVMALQVNLVAYITHLK